MLVLFSTVAEIDRNTLAEIASTKTMACSSSRPGCQPACAATYTIETVLDAFAEATSIDSFLYRGSVVFAPALHSTGPIFSDRPIAVSTGPTLHPGTV